MGVLSGPVGGTACKNRFLERLRNEELGDVNVILKSPLFKVHAEYQHIIVFINGYTYSAWGSPMRSNYPRKLKMYGSGHHLFVAQGTHFIIHQLEYNVTGLMGVNSIKIGLNSTASFLPEFLGR